MADKIYNVKNRSASMVVYRIPELNVRREFAAGETKKIPYDELEKLTYQSGGRELLSNFLQVTEDEVINELNIPAEAEYYMSEQQVIELIKTGSLDAFLDCLDYAPIGVIDLIKTYSVSLPLTDTEKIRALKQKTGFDTEAALKNAEADKAPDEETAAPAAEKTAKTSGRRTTSNYKIVSKTEPKAE